MAEQPTPGPRARVPHAPGRRRDQTTYETVRGANDLPKITSTPSYKEKGRPEVNTRLPGLRERTTLRAQQITHD